MTSPETVRTGLTSEEIKQAFRDNLRCGMGRPSGSQPSMIFITRSL